MKRIYACLFLVSTASLLLEVTLTRIVSVMMWYHFSYLIISISLLGYGAAGTHLAVFKNFQERYSDTLLARYAALFSIAAVAGPIIAGQIRFPSLLILTHPLYILIFPLYYVLFLSAFYFAGMVIGMILKQYYKEINRLHFFDLAGAGLGCLLVVVAISWFGGLGSLSLASVLGATGSLIVTSGASRKFVLFRWGLLACALLFMAYLSLFSPELIKTPKEKEVNSLGGKNRPEFTRWSALTKVDVSSDLFSPPWFGADINPAYTRRLYPMRLIYQDGTAPTPMYYFVGDFRELYFLPHTAPAGAYLLKRNPEVLVIGPGGGTDVMIALNEGASKVMAVELNPLIYRVVTRDYAEYIGRLYDNPKVELVNAEGRNYLARCQRRFDIIQMSCVDTFAALSSGALSLSENYLYTVEAMESILDNLKDDGLLVYSRLLFNPPRESLRLVAIAIEALNKKEVKNPSRHLFILGGDKICTLMLKKDGFSREDAEKIDRFCYKEGFNVYHNPFVKYSNEFSTYSRMDEQDRKSFRKNYMYNISPSTDDSPFFFMYFKWLRLFNFYAGEGIPQLKFPLGHFILLATLLQVALLSAIVILWPLRSYKKQKEYLLRGKSFWGILLYFASLGMGYMAVEIVLMQKLMVFLGYPLRSLTVVLFSLLVSSALGSAISRRWTDNPLRTIRTAIIMIIILIPLELLITDKLFISLMGWPLVARIIITITILFPLGFVMGMPFPLGIGIVGKKSPVLIPWCWGINACFSVISAIGIVIISMSTGFRMAILLAAAVYLLGLFCLEAGQAQN